MLGSSEQRGRAEPGGVQVRTLQRYGDSRGCPLEQPRVRSVWPQGVAVAVADDDLTGVRRGLPGPQGVGEHVCGVGSRAGRCQVDPPTGGGPLHHVDVCVPQTGQHHLAGGIHPSPRSCGMGSGDDLHDPAVGDVDVDGGAGRAEDGSADGDVVAGAPTARGAAHLVRRTATQRAGAPGPITPAREQAAR